MGTGKIKRIEWDYFLSKEGAFKLLREQISDLTISEFDEWLAKGFIENVGIEEETLFSET